jgi:hypothetical protein
LGDESFCFGESLVTVSFAQKPNLKSIGRSAFKATRLQEIVIPMSVLVLNDESFHGCVSLVSVAFEKSCPLESIGKPAFASTGVKHLS